MTTCEIEHSYKVEPLFTQRARYVILYGGRAGSKSWEIAYFLVQRAMVEKDIVILCIREKLNRVSDSVHRLLENTIKRMGVSKRFEVYKNSIKCIATGSVFVYSGLQGATSDDIKGFEDAKYCWCEEGQQLSVESIRDLFPTIRNPTIEKFKTLSAMRKFLEENPKLDMSEYVNEEELTVSVPSEIIVSFNPDNEDDAVYERFIKNTPKSCILIKINYTDNPNCPADVILEANECKARDIDEYNHVWQGNAKNVGLRIYDRWFNEDVHVDYRDREKIMQEIREKSVGCYMAIDPHSKYFPFCIWLAVLMDEHSEPYKLVYNECPTFDYLGDWYAEIRKKRKMNLTLSGLAELIYSYDGTEYGVNITARYTDTRYAKGSGGENIMTDSKGMIETWKKPENGSLILQTPHENVIDMQRFNIIQDLDYNKKVEISTFNKPKQYVAHWCKNTINMYKNHREARDGKGEDEKYKDGSDVMRILYAGIANESFKPVAENTPVRGGGGWMSA